MADTAHKVMAEAIGKIVLVKLRDGKVRGRLKTFDMHLNIVLEDAEEVREDQTRPLGTILIRGDGVVFVSPVEV
ncbi:LSm family protein [Ignicoccus hospitalis]|uniref:Putative snRNP Sm-like protein n=1 Tax=Ignicoccus hospitalis (strain KIN4/I / DSM 18386 / JCM 14125) TaxID=453591 RepID=A8AB56_IGNH4|nr:LSm family protein [Ignicoccus hospitalis]ABU82158.1 Like-Sm ribonucleoprotein, core [Ignicoccus hospitalis KIN4/I]HIH91116.1 RNA-binding protein [Desulfurococcaceae archaeon]